MKKSALLTAALLLVSSSYAMAAPINQMANHETAVGVGTKESYIEHKVTNKATVGFQYADRATRRATTRMPICSTTSLDLSSRSSAAIAGTSRMIRIMPSPALR